LAQGASGSWQTLASRYLGEYLDKIRLATDRLPEELVWWRPHQNALSVGNLILHLHGNLSMWISSGLGKAAVVRQRGEEFTADRTHGSSELNRLLSGTVQECRALIESIPDEVLSESLEIQGYDIDVRGAIFHAIEHMSYHTGQILYIVKTLTSEHEAFDFYTRHQGE
jgi:uncharacterized damage-inducible protein DinB